MTNDAIRRLREPAAWVLVGTAIASVVGGLFGLIFGMQRLFGETLFSLNAAAARDTFISPMITALTVGGVLLATHAGERLPRARVLVMVALGVQGTAALFGAVSWLASFASPLSAVGAKLHNLLYGAGELAVLGVAGFFTVLVFRSLPAPPKPQPQPGAGYPGYAGYPHQGAPGQPTYAAWPQPAAGQQPGGQPGQPGEPADPPAAPAAYPEYAQPQPGTYPPQPSGQYPPQPSGQPNGGEYPPAPGPGYPPQAGPEYPDYQPHDGRQAHFFGHPAAPEGQVPPPPAAPPAPAAFAGAAPGAAPDSAPHDSAPHDAVPQDVGSQDVVPHDAAAPDPGWTHAYGPGDARTDDGADEAGGPQNQDADAPQDRGVDGEQPGQPGAPANPGTSEWPSNAQ